MKPDNAHEFAFFVDPACISLTSHTDTLTIVDPEIINRISRVLRLKIGKKIVLCDRRKVYSCTLRDIGTKNIVCKVDTYAHVVEPAPVIDLMVPLLERDALEDVIYMATVYGVRYVHLIVTDKSRQAVTEKDQLRLEKIAVAAAEQSKQFYLPKINRVVALEKFLLTSMTTYQDSTKLWCDISGTELLATLDHKKGAGTYLVACGPEGDFTHNEKKLLEEQFLAVKLTGSVLRAKDAVSLALGIMRTAL